MVGSIENLYESIETLNECYIQPNKSKDALLKPVAPLPGYSVPLLSLTPPTPTPTVKKNLYKCGYCQNYSTFTDDPRATCPNCASAMTTKLAYVAPPPSHSPSAVKQPSDGGFVKGVVTYMVMDDLTVKPLSTISSITLLAQFKIKDLSSLEERVVKFGMPEAVKLLKASLETDKVLTSVFFNQKNYIDDQFSA